MSIRYEMRIRMSFVPKGKVDDVISALTWEWFTFIDPEDFIESTHGYTMEHTEEGNLCGGEEESEFVERIAHAVWKACGQFVNVGIVATCLDLQPVESYRVTVEDYDKYIERRNNSG